MTCAFLQQENLKELSELKTFNPKKNTTLFLTIIISFTVPLISDMLEEHTVYLECWINTNT